MAELDMRMPVVLSHGIPDSTTPGWVGLLAMDITQSEKPIYKCTAADNQKKVYAWMPFESGSGGDYILTEADKAEIANLAVVKALYTAKWDSVTVAELDEAYYAGKTLQLRNADSQIAHLQMAEPGSVYDFVLPLNRGSGEGGVDTSSEITIRVYRVSISGNTISTYSAPNARANGYVATSVQELTQEQQTQALANMGTEGIFTAQYRVTTFAEIDKAMEAGKKIFLSVPGGYTTPLSNGSAGFVYTFIQLLNSTPWDQGESAPEEIETLVRIYRITNSGKWEMAQFELNGGGGGGIDVTAAVGQTIRVTEVDTDGKPTAWEAAEYQPRTHWSEIADLAEILPETTPIIDSESGMGIITSLLEIKVGSTYTVTWNGVNYICVGEPYSEDETEMGVALGNYDAIMGTGDTGEPFAIIAVYAEYYDGNVGGMIIPLDGAEEPVVKITGEIEIVHTLEKKYLPELRAQKTIILNPDEQTASANSPDFYDADVAELTGAITIIDNGIEYPACGLQKEVAELEEIKWCRFYVFYLVNTDRLILKKLNWSNRSADFGGFSHGIILDRPEDSDYARVPAAIRGYPDWRDIRDYAGDRVVLKAKDEETNDIKYFALTVDYSAGTLGVAEIPSGIGTSDLWS